MPIIEVLKARAVTNLCVVVTRYFGGILLGAGGLVRAYAKGAALALDACGVGTMHPTARYMVDAKYPVLGRLERYLEGAPVKVEDKAFTDVVTITYVVKCADEERVAAEIVNLSEGDAAPLRLEELYLTWSEA
jgi:putative IMPACT (imprinted ancient) family translation regulator